MTSARFRHIVLFAALYASEGAPVGYLWWALPVELRMAGVPVDRVAALGALLVVPWTFKFVWAPLIDVLRGPRFGLRAWITTSQVVMGLALLATLGLEPARDLDRLVPLLLVHAVAAATQDAAIDALCVATVAPGERGVVNAWMQVGMLGARAGFGGGALLLMAHVGRDGVMLALVAVVWASLVVLWTLAREPAVVAGRDTLGELARAVRSPATWRGLGFALLGGAAFESVGALAGPYLIDRGVGRRVVGSFFLAPAAGLMAVGALAGGRLADRTGPGPTVRRALVGIAALVTGLAGIDFACGGVPPGALVLGALGLVYAAIGIFTAASYALLMDLTRPQAAATQFSAYMGATNACEAWAAWGAGAVAARAGYPAAFVAMAAASLVALPVLGTRAGARWGRN